MKKIILAIALFMFSAMLYEVKADPPEGMVKQMIPFPAMCLPATVEKHHFATLMGALINDYGVHISMTFSTSPDQSVRVAIIENPHFGLAGVLLIADDQSCITFSGEDRKVFVRPPDHPVGEVNKDTET